MSSQWQVLRHHAAGPIWRASACSAVALWAVQIAVAIHVLAEHSVSVLAVVVLAGTIPSLICTPLAGVCADRFNVRTIALVVIGLQIFTLVALIVTMHRGLVPLSIVYAVQGVLSSFWPPARQRWLYSVIDVHMRQAANASIGSISGLMTLVGAAGGGLLSAWRPDAAVAVAAVLMVATLTQLWGVSAPQHNRDAAGPRLTFASTRRDLLDGLRAARDYPLARSVIWVGIAWGFIGGGYEVLLAGHVTGDLGGSGATLGLFYLADGVSVIIATSCAARLPRARHLGFYGAAYVVQGAAWAATFGAPTLWCALAALIVMRLSSGIIIALDTSILLDTVPDRLRGRITSLHMSTYNAVARISLAALSAALTQYTLTVVGLASGAASVAVGVLWWIVFGRRSTYLYADRTEDLEAPLPDRKVDNDRH